MTSYMFVCIGIPASGKSTWAQDIAKQGAPGRTLIVSRDAIRLNMFGVQFDPAIEGEVSKIQDRLILDGLRDGKVVIVDNTNLRAKYRNDLKKLCQASGVHVVYKEIFFDTPVAKCRARNDDRIGNKVPAEAFDKFVEAAAPFYNGKIIPEHRTFMAPEVTVKQQYDYTKQDIIICDLDGTLADLNGRDPYDPSTCDQDLPVKAVVDCLNAMYAQGKEIIFVSGREDKYRNQTSKFLAKCTTFPSRLFMRATGDTRKDDIIKREIFDREIANKYNVIFVLDDRPRVVRMWRYDLGLTVFQLNDKEF